MKKKYSLFVLIIVFTLICFYNKDYIILHLNGKYHLLENSDKDDIYENLLLTKNNSTKEEFDKIITYLLSEKNYNLLSKQTAIRFVHDYNTAKYLLYLKKIKNNLTPISFDTSWTYILNKYNYQTYKYKNPKLGGKYNEIIKIDTTWLYKFNEFKDSTILLKSSYFVYCLDMAILRFENKSK